MIDLEDFKFGKTRITAFSLINSNTEEHKQLMVDWKKEYPKQFTGQISVMLLMLIPISEQQLRLANLNYRQKQLCSMTALACWQLQCETLTIPSQYRYNRSIARVLNHGHRAAHSLTLCVR